MQKVLIYIALQREANPLIETLALSEKNILPDSLPMNSYWGQHENINLCLLTSGLSQKHGVENVGTEPAAVGLYAGLQCFDADLVINAGTAGGFIVKGANIGDIYLGKSPVRYHDHRIQLPGYDAYGVGSYECMDTKKIAEKLGYKSGYISTSNALDHTAEDRRLMTSNQADCKEMECAALAWICHLYKIPFLPIKAITDLVDGNQPTEKEFLKNLDNASLALKKAVMSIIDLLKNDY